MAAAEPHAEPEEAERQDAKGDGKCDGDGVAEGGAGGIVGVTQVRDVPAVIVADKAVGVAAGEQLDPWPWDAVTPRGDVDPGGLGQEEVRLSGCEDVVSAGYEVIGEDVPGEAALPDRDEW